MSQAARLGDSCANHGCMPATPIIAGSGDVSINGMPAARKGDAALLHACPCPHMPHGIHDRSITAGSSTVSINGQPAARVGDALCCGGQVAAGSGDVFIGDTPYQSPLHACGESAVKNHAPLLAISPMPLSKPMQWGNSGSPFIAANAVVNTTIERQLRYQARKRLAISTANEPALASSSERLAFNNDNILRAEAAQYVYRVDEHKREPDKFPLPPKAPVGLETLDAAAIFKLDDPKKDPMMNKKSGFGAQLFKSEISGETMLAFRGTNIGSTGLKDAKANIGQGGGRRTKQYEQAMDLADLAVESLGDVVMVGHSLGGGLAASAVGVTGQQGYTFNAAGLHEKTVSRRGGLKMIQIDKLIQTQAVDGEFLTLMQDNRRKLVPALAGAGMLAGPGWAVAGAVAGRRILSGGALPQAPGKMHALDSIDGGHPITRHGMEQVIDGIEEQKKQDINTLSQFHRSQ